MQRRPGDEAAVHRLCLHPPVDGEATHDDHTRTLEVSTLRSALEGALSSWGVILR